MISTEEQILDRLDQIQATLALAFSTQLRAASDAIREDKVNAAILDATKDWIGSGALQEKIAKQLSISTRSVRDRFPDLLASKVIASRGPENRPEFRSTGLI